MKSYTAADFLSADINVKRILRVWHLRSKTWSRPDKLARTCEGLLYFVSGTIEYYFEGYTFRAYPGQIVKLPSGIPYNGKKIDDEPLEFYLIDFECEPGEFSLYPIPHSFYPTYSDKIVNEFKRIHEMWHSGTICSYLACKSGTLQLLCDLANDYAVNHCQYDDRSRILRICAYINDNSHRCNFRVSDAADHFHVSEAHLRRIFSNELQTSPSAYLSSVRIEHAKNLLITSTDIGVTHVAEICGFSSVYYFSSMFKRAVGCTPSEYRARMMTAAKP